MSRRYNYHVYLALDFGERADDLGLSNGAYRLHVSALHWIARQDGRNDIPDRILPRLMPRYRLNYVSELVAADWWRAASNTSWAIDMVAERSLHPGTAGKPLWTIRRDMERRQAIPRDVREAVYARDGRQCVQCFATDDLTLDHIHPYSLGGGDEQSNLRTLCRPCNSRKGAKV